MRSSHFLRAGGGGGVFGGTNPSLNGIRFGAGLGGGDFDDLLKTSLTSLAVVEAEAAVVPSAGQTLPLTASVAVVGEVVDSMACS